MDKLSRIFHGPTNQEGKIGYVIAWMLGVPLPLLLIIGLLRGCS